MSGICGWVGEADRDVLDRMLGAIDYRGDRSDSFFAPGVALGYRFWGERPGKAPAILRRGDDAVAIAGTLAPPSRDPAAAILDRLKVAPARTADLDGAFAAAWWDAKNSRMTFVRDPFGVRSLYYLEFGGTFYFASELKQILAIPGFSPEADPVTIHKYLTFSFVPGESVPVRGVKRILAGQVARLEKGKLESEPYFSLREEVDPALEDQDTAVRLVRKLGREAVARRLNGEAEVGLFLSGGLDSSGIGHWLGRAGAKVRAFSLDFGERSVEKPEAEAVAKKLGVPLEFVKVGGEDVGAIFEDLVWKLDLPFGDAVTGPQYLLGRVVRAAGLSAVFSGEGGDQFFGGWTNKPMISAEIYGNPYDDDDRSREEVYLRSYHRFYGLENELYSPSFQAAAGGPGQRRAHLAPYLGGEAASTFLARVRLADIALKGSQNILPRAERMSNAWGLDARVPLFDRQLAEAAFRLPPSMKLNGACEKYVLKLALQKALPTDVVWRKKYGMSVPVTDWVLGPLAGLVDDLLGDRALASRGFFRAEYVAQLRRGENDAHETRRRRLGEKLWTLLMLEAWMRVFIDGRGRRPGSASS